MTDYGIVDISPLVKLAEDDKEGNALLHREHQGNAYSKKATELCSNILDIPGIYVWGYYVKRTSSKGLWRTVYVGKAGKGENKVSKTANLRYRILKELRDERCFLWIKKPEDPSKIDELTRLKNELDECQRVFELAITKGNWDRNNTKTNRHFDRALEKRYTTHIIWVAMQDVSNSEIEKIETDLIETINPIGNRRRDKPTSDLQKHTIEIIRKIKHLIHTNRP